MDDGKEICTVTRVGRFRVGNGVVRTGMAIVLLFGCGSATPSTKPPTAAGSAAVVSSSTEASTVGSTVAQTATTGVTVVASSGPSSVKFCKAAKELSAIDAQQAADLKAGAKINSPGYWKTYYSAVLPILLEMKLNAPDTLKATASSYVAAFGDLVSELAKVDFQIPPPDPAGRKVLTDAMGTYGPIAVNDLPKLDAGVSSLCGFSLNLAKSSI